MIKREKDLRGNREPMSGLHGTLKMGSTLTSFRVVRA